MSAAENEDLCAVCGATSTGYHYGCYACEGCKSFFKRTVQKNLMEKYQCQNGDDGCEITLESRAKCQACRLKKCLNVGMVFGGKDLIIETKTTMEAMHKFQILHFPEGYI
jgi:hypothetical protein